MNIGVASLSFWENSVRPIAKAANSLIRLKMAPDYLENHKQEIEEIRQSFKKPSYKLQFV